MAFSAVDGTWMNDPTYDAAELRHADGAMFAGNGTDAFGVRGGIVYQSATSLAVTVDGADVVTVQPGACVFPGNAVSGTGPYRSAIITAQTQASVARDLTNPRIDLVIFRALDDDVVGVHAAQHFILDIIEGTPSATPSAPTLPDMAVELGRITMPQSGGGAATVDLTNRTFACAVGGVLLVTTFAKLPVAAPKWQEAVALDTGDTYRWTGSAWDAGAYVTYTPTYSANITIGNATVVAKVRKKNKEFDGYFKITVGNTTVFGAGALEVSLPYALTVGSRACGSMMIQDTGSLAYRAGSLVEWGNGRVRFMYEGGVVASDTVPWTWAATDVLTGAFHGETS